MDLRNTYNKIADDWVKDHEDDVWWKTGTIKFFEYLKPGSSVLDVGCAGGMKSEFIAKQGYKVTAIDISDKMIEIAKHKRTGVRFLVRDITKDLDLNERFDGIFAQAVLLHIPKKDVRKVIANIINTLNPQGFIYVAVKKLRPEEKDEQIVKENDYGYEYERFFSFYSPGEIESYLQELELKVVYHDITLSGETEWIQVIAQKNG